MAFSPKMTPAADGSGISLNGSRKRGNIDSETKVWLAEIKTKNQGSRE